MDLESYREHKRLRDAKQAEFDSLFDSGLFTEGEVSDILRANYKKRGGGLWKVGQYLTSDSQGGDNSWDDWVFMDKAQSDFYTDWLRERGEE